MAGNPVATLRSLGDPRPVRLMTPCSVVVVPAFAAVPAAFSPL